MFYVEEHIRMLHQQRVIGYLERERTQICRPSTELTKVLYYLEHDYCLSGNQNYTTRLHTDLNMKHLVTHQTIETLPYLNHHHWISYPLDIILRNDRLSFLVMFYIFSGLIIVAWSCILYITRQAFLQTWELKQNNSFPSSELSSTYAIAMKTPTTKKKAVTTAEVAEPPPPGETQLEGETKPYRVNRLLPPSCPPSSSLPLLPELRRRTVV